MPTTSFDIRLADSDDEHFILSVIRAPHLNPELARKVFKISKKTLDDLTCPDPSWAINSKDEALRAPGSSASESLEACGKALFDALIWDHKDLNLSGSWKGFASLSGHFRSLRLVLANQVLGLPWEALRDPYELNGSLARQLSVVRYIPASQPLQPLNLQGNPLRMLAVFANPSGDPSQASAIQEEQAAINEALQTARVCIDFIGGPEEKDKRATLERIKDAVAAHQYHILHYFGHGHSMGQGQLDFEGVRHNETALVSWEDLQDALQPTLQSLRLVILNACDLARPGEGLARYSPFTNLASCFLNAGVAMVVAMQYPIRTDTATTFTRRFYEHLAAHPFASAEEIEAAVVEGRKAIIGKQNAVEWVTPVVFTSVQEDEVFWILENHHNTCAKVAELIEKGSLVEAAETLKTFLKHNPESEGGLRLREQLLHKAATMIEQMDPRGGEIVDILD
jgi:hypothetical protein